MIFDVHNGHLHTHTYIYVYIVFEDTAGALVGHTHIHTEAAVPMESVLRDSDVCYQGHLYLPPWWSV